MQSHYCPEFQTWLKRKFKTPSPSPLLSRLNFSPDTDTTPKQHREMGGCGRYTTVPVCHSLVLLALPCSIMCSSHLLQCGDLHGLQCVHLLWHGHFLLLSHSWPQGFFLFLHNIFFSYSVLTPFPKHVIKEESPSWLTGSALSCTESGWRWLYLSTSINWERSAWRAALQKGVWGCWLAEGSMWVSHVSWHPRSQTTSWGASNAASPACQKWWLSLCGLIGVASPWLLYAVLCPKIWEGYEVSSMRPG